jgi:hypothetical protein
LRTALWFSAFGFPKSGLILPYTAQSPTLFKRMEFKNKKDVYDEIYRVLYEPATQKYGIGQSLYYQLPLFCNPDEYIDEWCYEMIQDYHLVNHYNVPMSDSLENVDAFRLDCFTVIEDEANKIRIFKAKDGN